MKKKKPARSAQSFENNRNNDSKNRNKTNEGSDLGMEPFPDEKPKFICAVCQKIFSDKNCLKKHIKKIHDMEPGPLLPSQKNVSNKVASFKCRVCNTEFAYKRNLKRHLIKYHSQGLEDQEGGNCFCNVEGCKFRSFFINALRNHLTDEHEVIIETENNTFISKAEFDRWKEEEEKTNVCLFIKEAGKHTLINGDQRLIYQCHRSGHYSGHGFGRRSFRVKGTCKLGKRCTAGIELTVKEQNNIHEVVYYKTHIWHTADVEHINLSASERMYLANKLKEGASISSILESVRADKSVEGTNLRKRIHLLKRKDLVNIENTFRLNNTERHLRKEHTKGQKIEQDKIKKNLDGHGEVVSWVIETPNQTQEYFTVKRLQPKVCVENCGVICIPCNTCLHMYSCTCHDFLLYGTMCQHIHSIALTLNPVEKNKRPKTNNGTIKKKGKEKYESISIDTGHKENDIISFLTKNLELQREQELQQDKSKLRQQIEVFNSLWESKIDQLDECSVKSLMKIVDSAIEAINIPLSMHQLQNTASSIQHRQPNVTTVPSAHIQTSDCHTVNLQGNMTHIDLEIPNTTEQITEMEPVLVTIEGEKKYISHQCGNMVKKKRKIEEEEFYRSETDKRAYENVINDQHAVTDNYGSFDRNLSWQSTDISSSNASMGKWWT